MLSAPDEGGCGAASLLAADKRRKVEVSIREFCRQYRLRESQFYWWQRRLKETPLQRTLWKNQRAVRSQNRIRNTIERD
jgi:hypothetical protein